MLKEVIPLSEEHNVKPGLKTVPLEISKIVLPKV